MKKVLGALVNAILWAVTAVLVLFMLSGVLQQFNKKSYTGLFGIGYAVVVSGSMEPNLHVNDMIVYHAHNNGNYQVGQMVVYTRPEPDGSTILISHRIVEMNGDEVITKGDANQLADSPITKDRIVGKIVFRIPKVGNISSFLKTGPGITVFAALLLLILLLNFLPGKFRKKQTEEPDQVTGLLADAEVKADAAQVENTEECEHTSEEK